MLHFKVAQVVPQQRVTMVRGGAGSEILFRSPGQSPGRAIVLPLASASAWAWAWRWRRPLRWRQRLQMLKFYVKVFYVMGKALSGELSCPCDRSCLYLLCSQAWRCRLHAPWACRAPRPCQATDMGPLQEGIPS